MEQEKKEEPKFKKPSCPQCGSYNILTKRDGERWCRVCGKTWKK